MQTRDTLIHFKPNQKAPEDYLTAAINFGATVCGAVVIEDGKLTVNKIDKPTVKNLQDLQEIFPDRDIIISLSNLPAPVDVKSRQPFVLQYTDDGEPAIVAFIEGDYSAHTVKDGLGSDAYYACTEHIEPLVELFWSTTGGDVDKVFNLLNSTTSNKALHGYSGDRGNMMLVFNNGKVIDIMKNDQDAEFDWGDVSRHHDYGMAATIAEPEVKATVLAPVETSAQKMARIMGGSVGDTAVTVSPEAKKAELRQEVLKAAAQEAKSTTAPVTNGNDKILVDISGYSNGQKKKFFDKYNKGIYPDGFKDMKTFFVPVSEASTEMMAQAKRTEPSKKDTEPKIIPSSQALTSTGSKGSVPTVASTLIVPVIPVDQIKAFKEKFLQSADVRKIMQETGGNVPDAAAIQKMEEAFPRWAKQTDFPLVRAALFSHSAFVALVRDYPQLAACLLGELSHSYLRNFKPAAATTTAVQDNTKQVATTGGRRR